MIVSYSWLKEYVEITEAPDEIARLLTFRACPVERVEPLGAGDARILIEVTFNRPDLLSHIGVAREIAGAYDRPLRVPDPHPEESSDKPVSRLASVEVDSPELCPRYTGRVIRNVAIADSPSWLKARIEAIGLRPVNNVVDVTNFVLMEFGQPLHAFDLARLADRKVVVRRARPGETMTVIDGTPVRLDPDTLVIADSRRPIAVAGIMGGIETEITERTRDILLESAYFDPVCIRRAVRRLGLHSDSSYRFERGVDPARIEQASRRAAALILELCGGELAEGVLDVDQRTLPGPKRISLRLERLRALAGFDIPRCEISRLLGGLGMEVVEHAASFEVTVPTARAEVAREADLVEEVLRTYGYDRVPLNPSLPIRVAPREARERAIERIKLLCAGAGYREVSTFSFVEEDPLLDPPLFTDSSPLHVRNPVRPEMPCLRRSLFGPLLKAKKLNLDRGNRRLKLFEVSTVYLPRPGEQPDERLHLGLLADFDFFEVKGAVEAIASSLGIGAAAAHDGDARGAASCRPESPGRGGPRAFLAFAPSNLIVFDALEQAELTLDSKRIGFLGKLSRQAAERSDVGKDRPVLALLDLDLLIEHGSLERTYREPKAFPAVVRDLAVVLDPGIPWAEVLATARDALFAPPGPGEAPRPGASEIERIEFLSVFSGDGKAVPLGKKSLAFRMEFRASDRTLTSEEADRGREAVKAALRARFGASFRE